LSDAAPHCQDPSTGIMISASAQMGNTHVSTPCKKTVLQQPLSRLNETSCLKSRRYLFSKLKPELV